MKQTGVKFIYYLDRKIKGTDTYGDCKECSSHLKKGQLCGSNRGNRYCSDCYERIFKQEIVLAR